MPSTGSIYFHVTLKYDFYDINCKCMIFVNYYIYHSIILLYDYSMVIILYNILITKSYLCENIYFNRCVAIHYFFFNLIFNLILFKSQIKI